MIFEDLENEKWEFLYERHIISNKGRIYSFVSFRFLNPTIRSTGYYCISLFRNAKYKTYLFHRLIAEKFLFNIDGKPCVNHINGIKGDNRVENLEWVTNLENMRHAIITGLRRTIPNDDLYTDVICDNCKSTFKRLKRRNSANIRRKAINTFCNKYCMGVFNKNRKKNKN